MVLPVSSACASSARAIPATTSLRLRPPRCVERLTSVYCSRAGGASLHPRKPASSRVTARARSSTPSSAASRAGDGLTKADQPRGPQHLGEDRAVLGRECGAQGLPGDDQRLVEVGGDPSKRRALEDVERPGGSEIAATRDDHRVRVGDSIPNGPERIVGRQPAATRERVEHSREPVCAGRPIGGEADAVDRDQAVASRGLVGRRAHGGDRCDAAQRSSSTSASNIASSPMCIMPSVTPMSPIAMMSTNLPGSVKRSAPRYTGHSSGLSSARGSASALSPRR